MNVYPMFTPRDGIRPRLFHKVMTKQERTYRGRGKMNVEREYVQFLYWSPKHDEILPWYAFLKDVQQIYLVVTDDLERTLRTPVKE